LGESFVELFQAERRAMIWRNKKRRVQLDLSGGDTSSHLETDNTFRVLRS